jgi:hypothetical protein
MSSEFQFFDVFGPTVGEDVEAAVTPQPLDLGQIQALLPPLVSEEFVGVVPTRLLSLRAIQGLEMIRKFFPKITWNQEFDAIQKYARKMIADEAITLVQKRFSKLKVGRLPLSVEAGNLRYFDSTQTNNMHGITDGIVAHLRMGCFGNVHDRHVVDVTYGSFEKEIHGPIQTRGHMIT